MVPSGQRSVRSPAAGRERRWPASTGCSGPWGCPCPWLGTEEWGGTGPPGALPRVLSGSTFLCPTLWGQEGKCLTWSPPCLARRAGWGGPAFSADSCARGHLPSLHPLPQEGGLGQDPEHPAGAVPSVPRVPEPPASHAHASSPPAGPPEQPGAGAGATAADLRGGQTPEPRGAPGPPGAPAAEARGAAGGAEAAGAGAPPGGVEAPQRAPAGARPPPGPR